MHFFSRLPIDAERFDIPKTSIFAQTPKWYQFKLRSLLSEGKRWLGCLGDDVGFERKRMILADEGGVGKTKAAALCVNYILNQVSKKPVLILVEPRQRKAWYKKLRRVLPGHQRINYRGSALNQLQSPKDGVVYVISKYSLHEHFESNLKSAWENRGKHVFSMIVIDECHKMKPQGDDSRNYRAEQNTCAFGEMAVGITASPLGIEHSDVWDIGQKLGLTKAQLSFFEPTDTESGPVMWDEWISMNEDASYRERIGNFYQNPGAIDEEQWRAFVDEFAHRLARVLPVNDGESFQNGLNDFDYSDTDRLFELLSELNPFSPCLCLTLREDLGEIANEVFRTMTVKTLDCPFEPAILEQLNDLHAHNRFGARRLHSHPNKPYYPNNSETPLFLTTDGHHDDGLPVADSRVSALISELRNIAVSRSETSICRGAVIFVEFLDTADYLIKELKSSWASIEFEGKPTLVLQRITSEEEDQHTMMYIDEGVDGYSFAQNPRELHVVVGTSAIEQGVDMPWANLIAHWDLPYNPRTLEQRTWRLDRHNEEGYTTEFEVVFFATGFEGYNEQVTTILERAQRYDRVIGRTTEVGLWPSVDDSTYTRRYEGLERSFLHAQSKELAEAWRVTASSEIGYAELQQTKLFEYVAHQCNATLDGALLEQGQLRIHLPSLPQVATDAVSFRRQLAQADEPLNRIRKFALLAENHDRLALAELGARRNHEGRTWLGIDGYAPQGEPSRIRHVVLDPRGRFVTNLQNMYPSDAALKTQRTSATEKIIFSIDALPDYHGYKSLPELAKVMYNHHNYGALYVINGDEMISRRMSYAEDQAWLLQQMSQGMTRVDENELSAYEERLAHEVERILKGMVEDAEKRLNEIIGRIEAVEGNIRALRPNIDSPEAELHLTNLMRRKGSLDEQINEIGNVLSKELQEPFRYQGNIRLLEVD